MVVGFLLSSTTPSLTSDIIFGVWPTVINGTDRIASCSTIASDLMFACRSHLEKGTPFNICGERRQHLSERYYVEPSIRSSDYALSCMLAVCLTPVPCETVDKSLISHCIGNEVLRYSNQK